MSTQSQPSAPASAPFTIPGFEPLPAQVAPDELARERQAELQRAADEYDAEQRHLELARRKWQNQRELAHMTLMAQLPKVVGAAVVGVVIGYLLPLGSDR